MNQLNEQDMLSLFAHVQPLFLALSDKSRQLIILQLIQNHSLSVTEITTSMDLSRPAISHHLKILKDAYLITAKRQGTKRLYHLSEQATSQIGLLEDLVRALRIHIG